MKRSGRQVCARDLVPGDVLAVGDGTLWTVQKIEIVDDGRQVDLVAFNETSVYPAARLGMPQSIRADAVVLVAPEPGSVSSEAA